MVPVRLAFNELGTGIMFDINEDRFKFVQVFEPRIEWIIYADDMVRRQGATAVAALIQF